MHSMGNKRPPSRRKQTFIKVEKSPGAREEPVKENKVNNPTKTAASSTFEIIGLVPSSYKEFFLSM